MTPADVLSQTAAAATTGLTLADHGLRQPEVSTCP